MQKQNARAGGELTRLAGIAGIAHHRGDLSVLILTRGEHFLHRFIADGPAIKLALNHEPDVFARCNHVSALIAAGGRQTCFPTGFFKDPGAKLLVIQWVHARGDACRSRRSGAFLWGRSAFLRSFLGRRERHDRHDPARRAFDGFRGPFLKDRPKARQAGSRERGLKVGFTEIGFFARPVFRSHRAVMVRRETVAASLSERFSVFAHAGANERPSLSFTMLAKADPHQHPASEENERGVGRNRPKRAVEKPARDRKKSDSHRRRPFRFRPFRSTGALLLLGRRRILLKEIFKRTLAARERRVRTDRADYRPDFRKNGADTRN